MSKSGREGEKIKTITNQGRFFPVLFLESSEKKGTLFITRVPGQETVELVKNDQPLFDKLEKLEMAHITAETRGVADPVEICPGLRLRKAYLGQFAALSQLFQFGNMGLFLLDERMDQVPRTRICHAVQVLCADIPDIHQLGSENPRNLNKIHLRASAEIVQHSSAVVKTI